MCIRDRATPHNVELAWVAIGTTVLLIAIAKHSRRAGLDVRWGHPLSAVIVILAMVNSLFHLMITGNSYQTTNFMVLAIAMGSFLLSQRLFGYLTIALLGSWGCAAFVYSTSSTRLEWTHFGFALLTSTILGWIIFVVRRANLVRLERLAWENQQ